VNTAVEVYHCRSVVRFLCCSRGVRRLLRRSKRSCNHCCSGCGVGMHSDCVPCRVNCCVYLYYTRRKIVSRLLQLCMSWLFVLF